ncbi:hypothetical protein CU098_000018, partial [Rhizopus stolonifer]
MGKNKDRSSKKKASKVKSEHTEQPVHDTLADIKLETIEPETDIKLETIKEPKEEAVEVQIIERQDPSQEYKRPELLEQAIKEIEAEVAAKQAEDASSSSESESDDDEDEDARLLTPAVDSDIFRTIAAIRAKDPRVYEESHKFFQDKPVKTASVKKEKKVTLKDYERDMLLKHGGFVDEEQENKVGLTHQEEQEQLKNAFKTAADDDGHSEDEDEGFLTQKQKSAEELEAEEKDYSKFLLEQMKADEHSKQAFEEWSNFKNNPNINEEDAFLMDYVLNRGWVEKDNQPVPLDDAEDKEKDEEFLDNVDRFETKYNYRFEEEGAYQILTYARDVEGSVRRKQSKRARKREREKLKKAAMKEQKMEEIKHQKNVKMKEIRDKLKEISDITGVKALGLEDINLDNDDDFDSSTFDAQMNNMYDDEFYQAQEGEENVKPEWNDDIDAGFDMDADYISLDDTEKKQRVKENKEKINALMDEYYKLNYEDVIGGDVFTRFKYAKTEKEDYGLTPEEILLADDAELNKYIGLKALAPYRPENKHKNEQRIF